MRSCAPIVLGLVGVAHAQPAPEPARATGPSLDAERDHDAAADRAFLLSTANAVPAGNVDASVRLAPFGGIASVAVGLGAGFEVSVDGTNVPDTRVWGVGAKLSVAGDRTWALALVGGVHFVSDASYAIRSFGVKISGCLRLGADCDAVATLGLDIASDGVPNDVVIAPNGSVIFGAGTLRFLAEGGVSGTKNAGGLFGFVGARIGSRHLSLDAGALFACASEGGCVAVPATGLAFRP